MGEVSNSPHGDIQYFAKVPGPASDLALSGIKESFHELIGVGAKLRLVYESYEADCKIVS